MNNITISPATANAAILAIAGNANMSAPERALIIKGLLDGRTFKATYMKAKPEVDDAGNPIPREAVGSLNWQELTERSAAYRAWLDEQEWKASKGLSNNRKQPHQYGNLQYWDLEKDSFRQFKIDNLISIEIVD